MKRFFLWIGIFFVLFVFNASQDAFANHSEDILGLKTVSRPELPPTIEGPGLLLSDSPFYFLDQLKQEIRLFLAFSPSAKAKLHADIAGERLAELRFMLAKNNQDAIDRSLLGFTQSYRSAAKNLTQAHMRGENVTALAKDITDGIKLKQHALDTLESSATGDMRARVQAAQATLLSAKLEVEDSLAPADLNNEIRYDVDRVLSTELRNTSESAKLLAIVVAELNREASMSNQQQLKNREEAVKTLITQTKEDYQKTQAVSLAKEQEKLALGQEVADQVKKIMEGAQKAAVTYGKISASSKR